MWLWQLPLLTKGPFALMYGGQDIINQVTHIQNHPSKLVILIITSINNNKNSHVQLSSESPGRGVPSLIVCSTIFQAAIIIIMTMIMTIKMTVTMMMMIMMSYPLVMGGFHHLPGYQIIVIILPIVIKIIAMAITIQVSLYAMKKVILSNRQQNYLDSLKGILVENALNM